MLLLFVLEDSVEHSRSDVLYETQGVLFVEYREVRRDAHSVGVSSQQQVAHVVKGPRCEFFEVHARDLLRSLYHLVRCSARESDKQNLRRLDTVHQKVQQLVRDDPGLSRSGSRDDERPAFGFQYGLSLFFIEFLQIVYLHFFSPPSEHVSPDRPSDGIERKALLRKFLYEEFEREFLKAEPADRRKTRLEDQSPTV